MGGRGGWITRSRDRDHLGQHGETPSLLKIQKKLAGRGGMRLWSVTAAREAEAKESLEPEGGGWSEQRLRHCTPAWQQTRLCLKKK